MKQAVVVNHRRNLEEVLLELTPRAHFWVGLFASAALAHFAPILIAVILGQWVNEVMAFAFLALTVAILMCQNLLGNKLKHIWLVNSVAAFLYSAHAFRLMAQQAHNVTQGLEAWWGTFIFVISACLLNAALFVQYKKVAQLG